MAVYVKVHVSQSGPDVVENVENLAFSPVAGFTEFDNSIGIQVCGKVYQHTVDKYNVHFVCYRSLQITCLCVKRKWVKTAMELTSLLPILFDNACQTLHITF